MTGSLAFTFLCRGCLIPSLVSSSTEDREERWRPSFTVLRTSLLNKISQYYGIKCNIKFTGTLPSWQLKKKKSIKELFLAMFYGLYVFILKFRSLKHSMFCQNISLIPPNIGCLSISIFIFSCQSNSLGCRQLKLWQKNIITFFMRLLY